jgi:DNA-binding MarR family transcriptional regulator
MPLSGSASLGSQLRISVLTKFVATLMMDGMSKGLGAIQRRVLDELARVGRTDTFELTAAVFGVTPAEDGSRLLSQAQLSSVRRAVRKLEELGFITRSFRRSNRSRKELLSVMEQGRFVEFIRAYRAKRLSPPDDEP